MAMDIAQLALAVDSRQAITAASNLDKMSASGSRAEKQFDGVRKGGEAAARGVDSIGRSSALVATSLQRVAAYSGLAFGVGAIVGQADAWTNLNNRLRLVTASQQELRKASDDVFQISQRTSQSIDGTAQVYQRFAQNADALKLSLTQVAGLTDTVSKAIAISGGTQQGNEAALVQFGQALASGVLRGEEFNSVMEQTPGLIDAIARGMGVTRGEMRGLANDGKLTADVLVRALQASRESVDAQFSTRVKTVSQSFVELQNAVQRWIGTANESLGVTSLLSGAIGLVAGNLDALGTGAAAFGILKIGAAFTNKARAAAASAAATRAEAVATAAAAAAQDAEIAASVAAAAAKVRDTQATIAQMAATNAAIVAERGLVVANIAQIDSQIARSQATIAAASSTGALSASIRLQAIAERELLAAQTARSAAMAALATLGAQQTRVTAAQAAAQASLAAVTATSTAATSGAAAATAGLTAATSAGALASRAGAAALGLLGGPIGAVATALTLGVVAWQTWGNSSTAENNKATEATRVSTQDIIGNLNAQIAKLKERNAMAAAGNTVGAAETPAGERMRELQKDMRDIAAGVGKGLNLPAAARDDLLAKLGKQYGELYAAAKNFEEVQTSANEKSRDVKTAEWLAKNGNNAQKLTAALAELKTEFKGVIPPEIEAAVRAKFKSEEDTFLARFDSKQTQYEKAIAELKRLRGGGEVTEEEKARIRLQFVEKKAAAEKLDAGERLAKQMEDRLAQLGAEGEAAQLNAQIAAGTVKFNSAADKQRAIDAATAMDIITDVKKRADEAKDATDALLANLAEVQAPYDKNADDFLTRMGSIAASGATGQAYEDQVKKAVDIARNGTDLVTQFSLQAARNIQDSLGDGLYAAVTGKFDEMGDRFLQTVTKMASDAAAAQIANALFGDFGNTNKIGGLFGTIFSGIAGAFGGPAPGTVPAAPAPSVAQAFPISMPRAVGGTTEPRTLREVGENGPELYSENGRNYLLSGRNSGNVTALRGSVGSGGTGGTGRGDTQVNIYFMGDGSKQQSGTGQNGDAQLSAFVDGVRMIAERTINQSTAQGGPLWKERVGMS